MRTTIDLPDHLLVDAKKLAAERHVPLTRLLEEVFGFLDALRSPPEVRRIVPGPRHWTIFQDLILTTGIRGSDTTDAYLAALALEHGCEWWTTDAGFDRFPGLRWRNLIA